MATLSSSIDLRSQTYQANSAVYDGLLKTLRTRQAWSLAGGGDRMVQRHRDRGKIPVRERIDLLIDPLSPFLELSPLAAWGLYDNAVPGAGLVTGIGTIRGVVCMIIANDATTKGGSFFKETIRKHVRAQDIAFENKLPVVYLVDCGGANLAQGDEVFPDQDHFGGAFYRLTVQGILPHHVAETLVRLLAGFGLAAVAGVNAFDGDHVAKLHRVPGPPGAHQLIGAG